MKEQVAMLEDVQLSLPPMKCCTDNAMMIALAGKVMYDNNKFSDLSLGIKPHLDLELESIGGLVWRKKYQKRQCPVFLFI